MTCKDCIHYEVCVIFGKEVYKDFGNVEGQERCPTFKDKSQIIDFSTYSQTIYFIKRAFDHRWILEDCLIFSDKSRAEAKLKELNR